MELSFDIHRRVPTATAGEGSRVLQDLLGIEPSNMSAVRNAPNDTMLCGARTVADVSWLNTQAKAIMAKQGGPTVDLHDAITAVTHEGEVNEERETLCIYIG